MNPDQQASLFNQTTHILLGTYDFRDLAEKAVNLVVKTLKNQGIIGAAIFRINLQDNNLHAFAYSTKYKHIIDKILPSKFSELKIPLSDTSNLILKAITHNQIQQSKRLIDFSRGGLSENITDKVQKLMGVKLIIALPIRVRSGKPAGAILFGLNEEALTPEQLNLFEFFSNQLGLAFSNVFSFEKLTAKYDQNVARQSLAINEEDIPTIKFTLRITPKENKLLERLARTRGQTKAEILRELLDKIES